MFPGEEFLPRAPEPEEIVIGGDDEEAPPGGVEEETAKDQTGSEEQGTEERESKSSHPEDEGSDIWVETFPYGIILSWLNIFCLTWYKYILFNLIPLLLHMDG